MRRALLPSTNPTGITGGAAALYAAAFMLWNWHTHRGVIDWNVIVAAAFAVCNGLWVRGKVTPLADPRDGNGQPLLTLPPPSVTTSTAPPILQFHHGRDCPGHLPGDVPAQCPAQPGVTLEAPTYPPPPNPPQATT